VANSSVIGIIKCCKFTVICVWHTCFEIIDMNLEEIRTSAHMSRFRHATIKIFFFLRDVNLEIGNN
jgi:hypothetical protein